MIRSLLRFLISIYLSILQGWVIILLKHWFLTPPIIKRDIPPLPDSPPPSPNTNTTPHLLRNSFRPSNLQLDHIYPIPFPLFIRLMSLPLQIQEFKMLLKKSPSLTLKTSEKTLIPPTIKPIIKTSSLPTKSVVHLTDLSTQKKLPLINKF